MKFMKKIAVFLLTLVVCFSIVPSNVSAASYVTSGKTYSMYLNGGESNAKKYTLYLKRAQRVDFTLTTSGSYCSYSEFRIYNSKGEHIRTEYIEENNTVGKKTVTYTDYLPRGEYTLYFDAFDGNQGKLTWFFKAKNISRITQRTHNIYSRAPTCGFRKYYFDFFGSNNNINIVKFNIPATGNYEFRVTAATNRYMDYRIYNSKVDEIAYVSISPDEFIQKGYDRSNYSFRKGTYYVVFGDGSGAYGIYKWMMRRIR